MMNIPEFYILGLPIDTKVSENETISVRFLLVKEYPDYFNDLQIVSLSKDQLIYKYNELNKDGSLTQLIEMLKVLSLYEIVTNLPELKHSYYRLFAKVFDSEEKIALVNEDNFEFYRSLVMKMNCMKEEKINPNPEIQRAIERSKRLKSQELSKLTFADVVSSVVGYNGLSYKDINEFTIYQLYMTYYRIAQIKNFDTSCLFATVSTEKINIESWSKHIDLFEEEKHALTREEFNKTTKRIFDE